MHVSTHIVPPVEHRRPKPNHNLGPIMSCLKITGFQKFLKAMKYKANRVGPGMRGVNDNFDSLYAVRLFPTLRVD